MAQFHVCILLGVLALAGCFSGKASVTAELPGGALPPTFSLFNGELDLSRPWWQALGSDELNRLIDMAISENFSLKEAFARLQQARATAVQTGADRLPALTAHAAAQSARQRTAAMSDGSRGETAFTAGLAGSYELDLWGGIRSRQEAALLDVDASALDLRTASLTVAAEVADRWVQIISRKLQKKLLEDQLESNQTFLELIELRFHKAMVSALDVYQQKQVVENVRARIPLVEAETRLLMHAVAALTGRLPRADLALAQMTMPVIGDLPTLGLPADLLANRPDVRAAGMRLMAAQWQVAAARANRLPALRFSANAQYGAGDLDVLFDTWILSLASNLTAPLFDGGRLAAAEDRARAKMDENLWAYRQTVLAAVKEVEDALESETRQREYIGGLEAVRTAARRGLEEAVQRYRRGLSDYLPVLTQLIAVQDLERDLIQQREKMIRYRIGLYRALGGGWYGPAEFPGTTESAADKRRG